MKAEPPGIAASAIAGTRWNALGAIVSSCCSLAVSIVLARILGPKPYGQVIIATTIYGFINLFVDGGFGQALIQKPELEEREIRTTFTLQIAMAAKITGILYCIAPWIARLFHDSAASPIIRAMSFIIVIQSTGLVSSALLRRRMEFKTIQYTAMAGLLCGNVLALLLAFSGHGVWSLVAGLLCQSALNSLLMYAAERHSIVPLFSLPSRSTTTFGGTIVAGNVVNWGHANLDNLAAAQLGPIGLGLYGRACNFAYQPVHAAVTGLQSVLFSTAARSVEKRQQVADLTLCVMAVVLGVLGSAYAVLALVPDTTVIGLLGEKWVGVVPLMLPLAIAMPLYGVQCLLGPIVCGLGRPALELWPQAISCAIGGGAFFAASRLSIEAVAWALAGVMLLRCGLLALFALRLLEIHWYRVVRVLAPRLVFAVAFGGLAWSADQLLRSPFHLAAEMRLPILAAFCAAVLGGSLWTAGELILGHDAIEFLSSYAHLLPSGYAHQLRIQARRHTTASIPADGIPQRALLR